VVPGGQRFDREQFGQVVASEGTTAWQVGQEERAMSAMLPA